MSLIQFIIAIVIILLFLVGAAILSLRLRTSKKIDQQAKENKENAELQPIEKLPTTTDFRPLKGERSVSFDS